MKRLAVVGFASFALLFGACDDDDDKKPDAGRDGGSDARDSGGDTGPTMCVGTFASTNRANLGAAVASRPTGACKSETDLDLICTADLGGKFRGVYAQTCLPNLPVGGPASVISCLEAAVAQEHPTLSTGCRNCYTALVSCTLANCSTTCPANPAGSACSMCQQTSGCLPTFFTCSGLPGGTPSPDGGVDATPDAGADTSPDTSVDANVDTSPDTSADIATDGTDA